MDSSSTLDATPTPPKTAGRKKIKIQRIEDSRNRQVTFLKRKNGLLKKAMELGILCDCEVSVIIFNLNNGKLFEYSSVEPQTVLQKYATYSGPSERRRKERFFELAASKGTSNIPVNEPDLAQAAMEAASAAVRRPRPTHKFSASHNSPEQGQYYNGRKLSSGESPGNLPVPEQGPIQAHLQPSNNPPPYPMPAPPAVAPSTAESAVHVENPRHQSGTALHMEYAPRYLNEDHEPPSFTPRSAGRQLSAAFGLPTPRTNMGPQAEEQVQQHFRHHLGLEQPYSQLPPVHSGNDHLRQTPSAGLPGPKPLPSHRSTVPSESTRLDATAPSNKEWSRSPNAPQVSVRGNVTDKEVAVPKPQHLNPAEHRHVQNVRNPGQRARPNLTVRIPNSNRESQQCGLLSAPNSLSSPSTGEDPFRGTNSSRIPSMSPFGNATWPSWNPNPSTSNDRDMPSVPLTPFLNMGAFGGGGESGSFGFGSSSNFALPSPTNAGLIPLTPRFLGIELPDTARPDNQSGGPQKRTFDFSFGARPERSPSRRRI